jgi:hypothetical protein
MEAILNFLTEKIKNGKNYIEKKWEKWKI